jgi:glycosyltransferase involved in cell wall biosynthesis
MTSATPFVSVIVPCRNEEGFIAACLESIRRSDYPKARLEILVVDGGSEDGTRGIVAEQSAVDPVIRLLDNPERTAPAAMNVGIAAARGDVVVRLDAHSRYPATYLSSVVEWLGKSGADNVGGIWRTLPANGSAKAAAIATGLSHPFGVGNSYFRIGATEPRWVDTVPYGCYRRDVFDRIGLFDEDLVRNQDDELNGRLIRHGGRILLVPEIVSDYYARDTVRKLWRMYYQYGYFKPLAARKLGRVMTLRQLIPALFVAALIGGALVSVASPALRLAYCSMVLLYLVATVTFALKTGSRQGIATALWLCVVFPALHLSYGIGFLAGLIDFVLLNRRPGTRVRALTPSR